MKLTRLAASFALLMACTRGPVVRPRAPVASVAVTAQPVAVTTQPVVVTAYTPPDEPLTREALRARMPSGPRLDARTMMASHTMPFSAGVIADPTHADGFDTVQQGRFRLDDDALAALRAHGFALAPRHARNSFLTGYTDLYLADQPVYLSVDLVLNALHEGFDHLLADLERDALAPTLRRALTQTRAALTTPAGASLPAETRADLDLYLSVTLSLLDGSLVRPVAGADGAAVRAVFEAATAAGAPVTVRLFGDARDVDTSQMRPRGHYAGDAALERYFRAVMFLGREGVRVIDVVDGRRVLRRRSLTAALALDALVTGTARSDLARFERTLQGLMGESDALGLDDLHALASRLDLRASDDALVAAIDAQRGERPRVATSILVNPGGLVETSPQPIAFSLTPQRFTPDAMVLSRVAYDRIDHGRVVRLMPDALDAAYGALGNDQALALLAPELTRFDYATELDGARTLVDAHDRAWWQSSLYTQWLSALRTLSPRDTLADGASLPATMTTEAWGRRLLNTQLAAWAELRHDTVLYAAQSYTMSLGCSYPDAYVDPYPATWSALRQWTASSRAQIEGAPWANAETRTRWSRWATATESVLARLASIATRERAGERVGSDDLAWVNQALNARMENHVCTVEMVLDGGWLYDLYEPHQAYSELRGVVADVHTQPTDEAGNDVGRVLHVGTGRPQLMAVLAGPAGRERLYLGFASSYRERITEHWDRLTDQRWREEFDRASSPSWLRDVSGPASR